MLSVSIMKTIVFGWWRGYVWNTWCLHGTSSNK